MATTCDTVTLNTGQKIPVVGLGTFLATKPGESATAVKAAVRSGYRLIDCAAAYGNEAEVGEAIAELISQGVVAREDLFIVSKIFQTHHDWEGDGSRCYATLHQTLSDLRLDYLDLLLIHWPFAFEQTKLEMPPGTPQQLRLPDGSPNPLFPAKMEYLRTWKVMESVGQSGKVRAIGVSNFTPEQLDHLISRSTIVPAVNQVEFHPYLDQTRLLDHCKSAGIHVMAYSPLGSSFPRTPPAPNNTTLLQHPAVLAVAKAVGRTPAQVLIRWSIQTGAIAIPKSSNPDRIQQNFNVFDWKLDDQQVAMLDGLNCNFRYIWSYLKRSDNNILWHDGYLEQEEED